MSDITNNNYYIYIQNSYADDPHIPLIMLELSQNKWIYLEMTKFR